MVTNLIARIGDEFTARAQRCVITSARRPADQVIALPGVYPAHIVHRIFKLVVLGAFLILYIMVMCDTMTTCV